MPPSTHVRVPALWLSLFAACGLQAVLGCASENGVKSGTGGSGAGGAVGSGGSQGSGGSGTGGSGTGGAQGTDAGASGGTGAPGTGGRAAGGSGGTTLGGSGGAANVGGSGGAANCAGHAVAFNANVTGNSDPAKARVVVDFMNSTDLPTGNATRTIEFWAFVKTTSWVGDANTMFFYGTNNRVADGFGLDFGATPGTIDPFTNNIFDNDNQATGLSPTIDQWALLAMTWDGTAVRAFVNGVEKANKVSTATQKTLMTGRTPLTIGGYDPAYFNGYIDELRIWSTARSAAEITSTMHHTLLGTETGLLGYWKFDETAGTTTADSTSTAAGHTAHPGTLMANVAGNLPAFVVSTAPLTCP